MKAEVYVKQEVEITTVVIAVPIRYGEEDMSNDFPLRVGDIWKAAVDIDTGKIYGWPDGRAEKVFMKVTDGGNYDLLNDGVRIASIDRDYVPHGVVPGEYGDYIDLDINESGVITNWPKYPDVSEFFPRGDD